MNHRTQETPSISRCIEPLRWVHVAALALSLAACGSDTTGLVPGVAVIEPPLAGEGNGPAANGAQAQPPLYLAMSWVSDAELTNTYVSVVDSLDVPRLDFSQALEIPGYGDAWVFEDWVFIADGETPKIGRYSLDDSGQLVLDVEIDFSNYGVASAVFWDNEFLSPTKAYLSNADGLEYIVWDPTAMQITGSVEWPEFSFPAGLDVLNSYTDRGGVVQDGYFFHGFYAHDADYTTFGDSSVVAVFDIETDELVSTIDVPCPMMDVASLGDDGYIYVSGWSYIPLSYLAGYSSKNCAARIDAQTRQLDATWLLNYADVTAGEQGSALRAVSGNDGIFAVFHGTGVAVTEGMDMWDLDVGDADWELYGIDLAASTVTPTGIAMESGSYYESHVDDRYFVYLASGPSDTQVYEHTASGYVPKFKAGGWMSRLFRLR